MQYEAVIVGAGGGQGLGAVAGHPHRQVPTFSHPGNLQDLSVVIDRFAGHQILDYPGSGGGGVKGGRALSYIAKRRVAPTHSAHGPGSIHLVESGEQRGQHRPIPGARIRHHRADRHVRGRSQHPAEDDERFLPQDMGIKGPGVSEPQFLRRPGQVHDAGRRRIGLKHNSEVHEADQPTTGRLPGHAILGTKQPTSSM